MKLIKDNQMNECDLLEWQKNAIEAFKKRMSDKINPFPCIPATQASLLGHLRYGFVGDPRNDETSVMLAPLLKEFSLNYKDYGKNTSLIVFFDTPPSLISTGSIENFERLFWEQLCQLNRLDEREWPLTIPENPENHQWEFCFHGERYFMYCATPLHKYRNSRYFPYMMLAITPRRVLQEFNKNEKYARKIKQLIHKRLEGYDEVPIHPSLNSYGNQDNYEWKQYFLHDDETELPKCPFLRQIMLENKE
ncbi:YqcI/YcgG family protein [Priestia megaterium]|nr:YqcI/YcgG family protein [Priestia megaterium]